MNLAMRGVRAVVAVAGVAGCAALALPAVAKADAAAPDECSAARVTGVSALLDTFSTGSAAGPSVLFGVALVPLSQPLPPPFDAVQSQLVGQSADGVQQMRSDAPAQIDQVRTAVAPLAAGNTFANQGVDATASALDTTAETGGAGIAPGDTTLREAATIVRSTQETAPDAC